VPMSKISSRLSGKLQTTSFVASGLISTGWTGEVSQLKKLVAVKSANEWNSISPNTTTQITQWLIKAFTVTFNETIQPNGSQNTNRLMVSQVDCWKHGRCHADFKDIHAA
jgi:hypothetical protein